MNLSGITDELRGMMTDAVDLVRAEGRLAQAETAEKLEQLQSGLISLLVGLFALMVAAFVLVQAGIDWLAQAIGAPAATLAFGLLFLAAGLVMFVNGKQRLKLSNLRPHRTIAAARRSAERVREAL